MVAMSVSVSIVPEGFAVDMSDSEDVRICGKEQKMHIYFNYRCLQILVNLDLQ
jgi:hypothetical protein